MGRATLWANAYLKHYATTSYECVRHARRTAPLRATQPVVANGPGVESGGQSAYSSTPAARARAVLEAGGVEAVTVAPVHYRNRLYFIQTDASSRGTVIAILPIGAYCDDTSPLEVRRRPAPCRRPPGG